MYQLSRTSPSTASQKANYSKFFYLRLAVGFIAILALVVEGITDYFSLFKTMSEFTTRYGFSDWIPATASLALVVALTLGFYALGSFVARSIFEDGFNFRGGIKEMNHFLIFAVVCLCMVGTSIYTLSTEGAQMVAGEYFSEKPVTKETGHLLKDDNDLETKRDNEVKAIEERYDKTIAAQKKASSTSIANLSKKYWLKDDIAKAKTKAEESIAELERQKAAEIKAVVELRNGQIKTKSEMVQQEYTTVSSENQKNIRKAEERNARNKSGGYYIAFFCLPLTTVCLALKAWIDVKCGIKLEVTVSKSDFSQSPFGAILFAIKDGLSGRMTNAAEKLHKRLAPSERLTFGDDPEENQGGWTNKGMGFTQQREGAHRVSGRLGALDFEEDFEKKN